jgi:hypothetical protein
MTTLALHDLKPARSNVLNFVARLQAVHGSPTVSIEERIRSDVAKQLGTLPDCAYYQAQAVNGWKNFRRTPDEAVRCAVQCARSVIREPDSAA